MHTESLRNWQHEHTFGQDKKMTGERRTFLVAVITAGMMIIEIMAGIAFGSRALLADGLHMASHATALGIAVFAYVYARRHARDASFTFGTGKVNALAGFASAVLLVVFALFMIRESVERLLKPVSIVFDQAIIVAVVGLAVNTASALILGIFPQKKEHAHGHDRSSDGNTHKHSDFNLRAAFFHVIADALTSMLAIFALLAGKLFGIVQLDPIMGFVGGILVARWSWGLVKDTSRILLDRRASEQLEEAIREAIEENEDNRISDLHVWGIGPGIYASAVSVVSKNPKHPEYYKNLIPSGVGPVHITVEVNKCDSE